MKNTENRAISAERIIFAKKFRQARKAAGISQERVQEYTGLNKSYISDIERCKVNLSLDNMSILANAIGVPLSELLEL